MWQHHFIHKYLTDSMIGLKLTFSCTFRSCRKIVTNNILNDNVYRFHFLHPKIDISMKFDSSHKNVVNNILTSEI